MKKFVISLLSVIFLCAAATAQVLVGMTDTTAYFPQLEGRRVVSSMLHAIGLRVKAHKSQVTQLNPLNGINLL